VGPLQIKKPEGMITVSASATSTEKRALIDAGKEAGLKTVHLISTPVAAALGAGLPITEPKGSVIIDIGNGTTEIGVFSLGGTVSGAAIRVGSSNIDEAIVRFMRREHNMVIGQDEIKRIKHDFVDLMGESTVSTVVHGRNLHQGTPKTATIKLGQLNPYIETVLMRINAILRKVMERTPPDILSDVIHSGIILSGGGVKLNGLPEYFSKKLHVAFVIAEDPESATINGAQAALLHLDEYRRSLLS
jgi:rod shape-determining protein MreB